MRLLLSFSVVILTTAPLLHATPMDKISIRQFNRLDANGDVQLDRAEFSKLLPAKWTKNGALDRTQKAMFLWFDADLNDGIDLGEWLDGQWAYGSDMPAFNGEVAEELDANHDDKLTLLEFKRLVGRYIPATTAESWYEALTISGSISESGNYSASSTWTSSETSYDFDDTGVLDVTIH